MEDEISKHIMIDIETLATSANAAIISIGACTFRLGEVEKYEIGETFLVGIDPAFYDYGTPGFDVCKRTVAWWSKQSKEARAGLRINLVQTLPLALDRMGKWFEDVGFEKDNQPFRKDAQRIWAYPTSFDLVILRNGAKFAYGDTDEVPWHYRQEMCARTHMSLFDDLRAEAREHFNATGSIDFVAHRADHDAIRQAHAVQYVEAHRND